MFIRLEKLGNRLFPERQILVRTEGRVSHVTLTRRVQATAAATILAGAAVLSYVSLSYVHFGRLASDKQAQAARIERTNADLRQTIAMLEAQLVSANAEIEESQNRLSAIGSQYGSLRLSLSSTEEQLNDLSEVRGRLEAERAELEERLDEAQGVANAKAGQAAQLAKTLDKSKNELHQTEAQKANLAARIRQLETDLQSAHSRAAEFKSSLDATQKKLVQVGSEREKVAADRERLAAERDTLKRQLHDAVGRLTAPASDAEEKSVTNPEQTSALTDLHYRTETFADIESLVASTGVNVESMLTRLGGAPRAEGGPYIALGPKDLSPEAQAKRESTLKKLLKVLPLASPLEQFQVESPFGPRIDPINKHRGFHPGIDLSAPFRSPIYSTAAGVVTFAGVNGNYGKYVEIDHGMGIVTHYAHLHRIMVALGQKVGIHQQIGQLGSTGRSTGPHVHYEVVVDGDPLDPEKFMKAGKNVVQVNGK